jgi:hypothetical protein
MKDKTTTDKKAKASPKAAEVVDSLETNEVSSVFFSHYKAMHSPLENKKIAGIIENITNLFQKSLLIPSSFQQLLNLTWIKRLMFYPLFISLHLIYLGLFILIMRLSTM